MTVIKIIFQNTGYTGFGKINTGIHIYAQYRDPGFGITGIASSTLEEENTEQEIHYLDMTLKRNDDKILTRWYTKEIGLGRFFSFISSHLNLMKLNVAENFVKKAFSLTSEEYKKDIVFKVRSLLRMNNYPTSFINRIIKNEEFKNQTSNQV